MQSILDVIKPIKLLAGSHPDTKSTGSGCFMNVVSYLNGDDDITDKPTCVDPFVRHLAIAINDFAPGDQRNRLLPFVERALLFGNRVNRPVFADSLLTLADAILGEAVRALFSVIPTHVLPVTVNIHEIDAHELAAWCKRGYLDTEIHRYVPQNLRSAFTALLDSQIEAGWTSRTMSDLEAMAVIGQALAFIDASRDDRDDPRVVLSISNPTYITADPFRCILDYACREETRLRMFEHMLTALDSVLPKADESATSVQYERAQQLAELATK